LEVVDDEFEEVDSDDPIKKYNIILDVNHPDFEEGTGRQFHVKWVNKPYSESNYEFERDLILNDVEYLDELAAYERRSVKPSKSEMQKLDKKADTEKKKLYTIFGEKLTMSCEKKEEAVQKYQKELEDHTFENGGQLRDYQAEGVSWLMANHVNKRSSILADEMGLG
jgi:SNF2 family DNA or RNA helicase